jgi:hypothetical protein
MKKFFFGLALSLTIISCASVRVAKESLDASAVDERWSLHVVTFDPDGSERVTRIWIALLDGDPVLRTGNSRWWANLTRDPSIRIRLAGNDYAYRAESSTDPAMMIRIDEAFLSKYGRWERMLFPQERGKTHTHYARLQR